MEKETYILRYILLLHRFWSFLAPGSKICAKSRIFQSTFCIDFGARLARFRLPTTTFRCDSLLRKFHVNERHIPIFRRATWIWFFCEHFRCKKRVNFHSVVRSLSVLVSDNYGNKTHTIFSSSNFSNFSSKFSISDLELFGPNCELRLFRNYEILLWKVKFCVSLFVCEILK